MGSAVDGVDVVGKGEEVLCVPVVVLEGDVDVDALFSPSRWMGLGWMVVLFLLRYSTKETIPPLY